MKPLIILLGALFTSVVVYAQDWSETHFNYNSLYSGYYVTNNGDTVKGFIRYGNKVENQSKFDFYDSEKGTNHKSFKPQDVKSYLVADKLYRSIHYSGGLLSKPMRFVLVRTDGAISEFVFYPESGGGEDKTVYYKANDPNNPNPKELQSFGMGFAKKMAAFVADDAELSQKVANKEKGYGMLKMEDIISEYNKWYASQHK